MNSQTASDLDLIMGALIDWAENCESGDPESVAEVADALERIIELLGGAK